LTHSRRIIAILALALLADAAPEDRLSLEKTIAIAGDTFHVQGIDVDGSRLWITSVDVKAKRGFLLEYKLPEGSLVRSVEIQDGVRFHPGGMMADGDSLWIPVAEYRKESTSTIQRRSKRTLELKSQFPVADHIGAIAITPDGLVGANWDARSLYVWDRKGKQVRKVANSSQVALQDMKYNNGQLVGGGLKADKSGAIVWMAWPSLQVARVVPVGRTDRGVAYTHEGMAIRNNKLWVLPEDAPSRLFVFNLR
jgi:hypothetical protein